MTTVQDLINAALRKLGILGDGQAPSTEETADSLTALNALIESWSAEALPIPQLTKETANLNAAATHQFGTRPLKLKSVAVTAGGMTIPYDIVTADEYGRGDRNRVCYYDAAFPNATLHLRPAPTGTLEVYSYKPLAKFLDATDTLANVLAPGYARALMLNLALEMSLEFGRDVPNLPQLAADAKTSIVGLNANVLGHPAAPPAIPAQE